jgi:hypothetical protein
MISILERKETINSHENLFKAGIAKFANITIPAVTRLNAWYTTKVIQVWITKSPWYKAIRAMKF